MAETRDLIVRSSNKTTHTKSFIRIGDESPLSVSETGSSIQFLGDLSDIAKTFDTQGKASAFRIRHDTVNGYLIFEGRSGSNGPYQLMRLNDDTNTVTFGGTVAFEDISFDQITGSHLYVGTSSRLLGTTSISFLSMTSSLGTASIWYDGIYVRIPKLQPIVDTWKIQYKLTGSYNANTYYTIYTDSSQKQIKDYNYLNVYLNGQLLQQSGSNILNWDYATGSNLLPPQIKFHYSLPYNSQYQLWITYVYNGNK